MSANLQLVEQIAAGELEEQSQFVRGVLFGMLFSLPLWGGIIALIRAVA